ncbi:MAG: hypothetical protein H6722_14580 [Sandaracinus sp.]|nr:hypothetical protein [Sandaracinus sp.]
MTEPLRNVVWCAALFVVGCALSHERDRTRGPDGGRAMDGGWTWVSDAEIEPSRDASSRVDASDATVDAPPPVDEILRYAERRCAWRARCSGWDVEAAWLRGEASCVNAERRRAEELLSRGHVPPLRTWCDAPEVDADCDGVDDVTPCTPLPGDVSEGEACVTDRECGLSSSSPMACGGCRCRPTRNEGEDCSEARPCGPELVCWESDGRCHRQTTLADGEACSRTDSSRVCRDGSTCHRGTCQRSPRYGEPCVLTGPLCAGASRCVAHDDGAMRCARTPSIVPAGEPCESGEFCAGGALCPRERTCPTTCADNPSTCGISACDESFDDCLLPPLRCPGL